MIINTIKVNLKLEFQFWHPNNRPFDILEDEEKKVH